MLGLVSGTVDKSVFVQMKLKHFEVANFNSKEL